MIKFERAVDDVGVQPVIIIYGKSGKGRSKSALRLAAGISGKNKRPVLFSSTNKGRATEFSRDIAYDYAVINRECFADLCSGLNDIFKKIHQMDCGCVVIDNLSDFWKSILAAQSQQAKRQRRAETTADDYYKATADIPKFYEMIRNFPVPVIITCDLKNQKKVARIEDEQEFVTGHPEIVFEGGLSNEADLVIRLSDDAGKYSTEKRAERLPKLIGRRSRWLKEHHGEEIAAAIQNSGSADPLLPYRMELADAAEGGEDELTSYIAQQSDQVQDLILNSDFYKSLLGKLDDQPQQGLMGGII